MSYLADKYRDQIQLHESNPSLHPYPTKLPSLSRSDYPQLVGGCDTESQLINAFEKAFSKECILRAWSKCGAVQLMRAALNNPTVRHVLPAQTENCEYDVVVIVGAVDHFDWKGASFQDLENEKKAACDKLETFGIDSKS